MGLGNRIKRKNQNMERGRRKTRIKKKVEKSDRKDNKTTASYLQLCEAVQQGVKLNANTE